MNWIFNPVGLDPTCPWWAFIGFCIGLMILGYGLLSALLDPISR